MLDAALIAHLTAAATTLDNRIYPVRLDQDVDFDDGPAATIQLISDPGGENHGGPDGSFEMRYQVTTYSPSALTAKTAQDEVRAALFGMTGTMGDYTVARVGYEGGADNHDDEAGPVERGGAVGLFLCPRDYVFQVTTT